MTWQPLHHAVSGWSVRRRALTCIVASTLGLGALVLMVESVWWTYSWQPAMHDLEASGDTAPDHLNLSQPWPAHPVPPATASPSLLPERHVSLMSMASSGPMQVDRLGGSRYYRNVCVHKHPRLVSDSATGLTVEADLFFFGDNDTLDGVRPPPGCQPGARRRAAPFHKCPQLLSLQSHSYTREDDCCPEAAAVRCFNNPYDTTGVRVVYVKESPDQLAECATFRDVLLEGAKDINGAPATNATAARLLYRDVGLYSYLAFFPANPGHQLFDSLVPFLLTFGPLLVKAEAGERRCMPDGGDGAAASMWDDTFWAGGERVPGAARAHFNARLDFHGEPCLGWICELLEIVHRGLERGAGIPREAAWEAARGANTAGLPAPSPSQLQCFDHLVVPRQASFRLYDKYSEASCSAQYYRAFKSMLVQAMGLSSTPSTLMRQSTFLALNFTLQIDARPSTRTNLGTSPEGVRFGAGNETPGPRAATWRSTWPLPAPLFCPSTIEITATSTSQGDDAKTAKRMYESLSALRVLIYANRAKEVRVWSNLLAEVKILQERFFCDVLLLEEPMEQAFPATAHQARLFNWADVYVASHGAHFANQLFMRPGTMAVEISCTMMSYAASSNGAEQLGSYNTVVKPHSCNIDSALHNMDFHYELTASQLVRCIAHRIQQVADDPSAYRGECVWDDTPAVLDSTCSEWGCSCQNMSNSFDVTHKKSFGFASKAAQAWWLKSKCSTRPKPADTITYLPL